MVFFSAYSNGNRVHFEDSRNSSSSEHMVAPVPAHTSHPPPGPAPHTLSEPPLPPRPRTPSPANSADRHQLQSMDVDGFLTRGASIFSHHEGPRGTSATRGRSRSREAVGHERQLNRNYAEMQRFLKKINSLNAVKSRFVASNGRIVFSIFYWQ